jgi:transcriptional regulator with XRE-family HTH domain
MRNATDRTAWSDLTDDASLSPAAEPVRQDEDRIASFRGLVHRLRTEAGLTQAELAARMGTTPSAIVRMEGGGTRPTLDSLEKLASAVEADLVVGIGENLAVDRSIVELERDGHAIVRRVR